VRGLARLDGIPRTTPIGEPPTNMNQLRPTGRPLGFTLIELLTVIAIIGILAAIIIPVVGKVRTQAQRARCQSNVRQIAASLVAAANEDRQQRFPSIGTPSEPGKAAATIGALPWDVVRDRSPSTPSRQFTISDLVKGAGRDVMYCPSALKFDDDSLFTTYAYATIDYILLVGESGAGPVGVINSPPNAYYSDRIRAEYTTLDLKAGSGLTTVPPSRRELVVDALAIVGTNNWNWTTASLKKRSNHIEGSIASGANIAFVDGHVAWRSVSEMTDLNGGRFPRSRTVPLQGGATFLW